MMIKIICVGKLKEKYLSDLVNDYKLRISKYQKIEIIELKDNNINDESNEIIKHINSRDYNILMDIKGDKLNSLELSNLIKDTNINGYNTITFIIGGSNGVNDSVKKIVNKKISFSDMTFPHGLFRGLLLEQIYRSFKIINNESYHK
ncbi:MAG: 23S rRNA (pseudouridine(1915)-N(3))-methyltransferase RlmH [Bacilli bacterium]|nr:23S rRNA (pseudouridine(1915)-N(3))-methyltransferase RlmH [Bacilli bacterium]